MKWVKEAESGMVKYECRPPSRSHAPDKTRESSPCRRQCATPSNTVTDTVTRGEGGATVGRGNDDITGRAEVGVVSTDKVGIGCTGSVGSDGGGVGIK